MSRGWEERELPVLSLTRAEKCRCKPNFLKRSLVSVLERDIGIRGEDQNLVARWQQKGRADARDSEMGKSGDKPDISANNSDCLVTPCAPCTVEFHLHQSEFWPQPFEGTIASMLLTLCYDFIGIITLFTLTIIQVGWESSPAFPADKYCWSVMAMG